MQSYHDALIQEVRTFCTGYTDTTPLKTIYVGGGTPSTWPPELLSAFFAELRLRFTWEKDIEITLEVNPGTVTQEKIETWKKAGINRLSIGVQSLNDEILKNLNRHQTKVDVVSVLEQTSVEFSNISVDFILGLPGVTFDAWKEYILQAMHWPITHISVYFLTVHEKTPLYFKIKKNQISLPPDDLTVDMYEWLVQTLADHGFDRYEISNFAKKGYQSKHNQAYWKRKAYKGFGLGACSFNGQVRYRNTKNLTEYIQAYGDLQQIEQEIETLESSAITMEKIMLGLRQVEGIDIYDIIYEYTPAQKTIFFEGISVLKEKKLIEQQGQNIKLTPQGYALENEIAVRLFP